MTRYILLLRAINLGAKRRVKMSDLKDALAAVGCEDVVTYMQSGNAVVSSKLDESALIAAVEPALKESFGFEIEVVARSAKQLAQVIADNPLEAVVDDDRRYQVTFLSDVLPKSVSEDLNDRFSQGPERACVIGREMYSWHPAGLQNSKLSAVFATDKIVVVATARNWRTVTKLSATASD